MLPVKCGLPSPFLCLHILSIWWVLVPAWAKINPRLDIWYWTLFLWLWIVMQWSRSPGKKGSHFDPNSDLFLPNEKKDIIASTLCWTAMVGLLVGLSCAFGPATIFKLYGVPYLVGPYVFLCLILMVSFSAIGWWLTISWTHFSNTDICCLVGSGHLLASSWPRAEASLVPWEGINFTCHS